MLNDYEVVLVKIDKTSIPDGLGGFEEGYREGAEFKGVVTHDSSTEMKIAEKQGVTSSYTVIVKENVPLNYGDIIKRKSDNQFFRITSRPEDGKSPIPSPTQITIFQAELHEVKSK